jgi:hypothetical protein
MTAILGCGQKVDEFQSAKSVKIEYRINGQEKSLKVSDPKQVKEILDTISIHHTDDRAPGWIVFNTVTFNLPSDKEIRVFLAKTQILDRPDSGLIYLNDTKFYDKINEIGTKEEGRKIDVLVDNK